MMQRLRNWWVDRLLLPAVSDMMQRDPDRTERVEAVVGRVDSLEARLRQLEHEGRRANESPR